MLTVWSPMDEEDLLSSRDVLPNAYFNVRAEVLCSKEYKNNEYVPIVKARLVAGRARYAKESLIQCQ